MSTKLLSNGGETLVEMLASMMVIVMGMTLLAGAVVSAGYVNSKAAQSASSMRTGDVTTKDATVTVKSGGDPAAAVTWYYKKNEEDLYCVSDSNIDGGEWTSVSLDPVSVYLITRSGGDGTDSVYFYEYKP